MQIKNVLKKSPNPNRKKRKLGRGIGSGRGKTSGRGHKGEKSRSGRKKRLGFEGGQMPLIRRIPKRGFNNFLSKEYQIVNLSKLSNFKDNEHITLDKLKEKGIIKKKSVPVKILASGEIEKKLKIEAHKFSKSAKEKIEKAGGEVVILRNN